MPQNVRTLAVVIATIVLIVGTYLAYEKYTRRSHVVSMVEETAARLRKSLEAQGAAGAAAGADAHAAHADAQVTTLRRMNASSFRPLADAADDYLVTSREILRRNADMETLHARLTASLDALQAHIKADRGRADWTREAVRLKQGLDKDVRDYRIAVESYRSLLQTLPASQARIAQFVEAAALVDEQTIAAARKRALDDFAATDENIRQTASLGASPR